MSRAHYERDVNQSDLDRLIELRSMFGKDKCYSSLYLDKCIESFSVEPLCRAAVRRRVRMNLFGHRGIYEEFYRRCGHKARSGGHCTLHGGVVPKLSESEIQEKRNRVRLQRIDRYILAAERRIARDSARLAELKKQRDDISREGGR